MNNCAFILRITKQFSLFCRQQVYLKLTDSVSFNFTLNQCHIFNIIKFLYFVQIHLSGIEPSLMDDKTDKVFAKRYFCCQCLPPSFSADLVHLFQTLGYKCNFYLPVQLGICLIPPVNLKYASILYAISKWRLFILHVLYEAQTESHLCLLSGSCRTNGLNHSFMFNFQTSENHKKHSLDSLDQSKLLWLPFLHYHPVPTCNVWHQKCRCFLFSQSFYHQVGPCLSLQSLTWWFGCAVHSHISNWSLSYLCLLTRAGFKTEM